MSEETENEKKQECRCCKKQGCIVPPAYTQEVLELPPRPPRVSLREMFYGKRVAIVGNGPIREAKGKEIDGHDIVVRFNNIYNFNPRYTGARTDILCFTPSSAWAEKNDIEKRLSVFYKAKNKALILFVKMPERWRWRGVQEAFGGRGFTFAYDEASPLLQSLTTGACFLAHVAESCENCSVDVYGFNDGRDAEFAAYLQSEGKHYITGREASQCELATRSRAISILKSLEITRPPFEAYRVVIPARCGSEGVKDKNLRDVGDGVPLLVSKAREAVARFGAERVRVLTDSERYAATLREYGLPSEIVPYIDREHLSTDDVSFALRRWCEREDFCGNVLLMQCTSPRLSEETLAELKKRIEKPFDRDKCFITVAPISFKSSAITLAMSDGSLKQMLDIPFSTPRQSIPTAYRFTGAATIFNSQALRGSGNDSFFKSLTPFPILISEEEGDDIDTEKDLIDIREKKEKSS